MATLPRPPPRRRSSNALPARTRLAIRTVLLASRRPDCLLSKLDRDTLFEVFGLVAAWAPVQRGLQYFGDDAPIMSTLTV